MTEQLQHIPVLMNEVLDLLAPSTNQNFLDCTLGGGGHAKAILQKTGPSGKLWGIDRDTYALQRAGENLKEFTTRVQFVHGKFSDVNSLISDEVISQLNGALIDCGVSSFQLDDTSRGFSFRNDAPLDMRMNPKDSMSAKDFLYEAFENEIADVIFQLGEERNSRKIAKNIVFARNQGKLNTTFDLVEAVMKSFPPRHYWKINPATKTFQAIRMKINGELEEIEQGISSLISRLAIGSKLVVITFHSLEDRLVKHIFKKAHQEKKGRLLNKKPLIATEAESSDNPRSRSAKVRGIEIISV